MSHKLPVISGEDLVKYLAKQGFEAKRQTSSHVVMQKRVACLLDSPSQGTKERHPDWDSQAGWDRD